MKNVIIVVYVLLFNALCIKAQISLLSKNIQYEFSIQGTAGGGDNAPFWFTNNRYGLGTTENFGGLARVALWRTPEVDSLRMWRIQVQGRLHRRHPAFRAH